MYLFEQLNHRARTRGHEPLVVQDGTEFSAHDLLGLVDEARSTIATALGPSTSGARVALCAHPGIQRLAFVLAIWASGAVYVPFDPDRSQPARRLTEMARISRPSLIVIDQSNHPLADIAEERSIPVRFLPETPDWQAGLGHGPELVAQPLGASSYIVFTSGSTGEPKAVELSHATVDSLLRSLAGTFSATTRVLQSAPVTFDMSLKETLAPISNGGVLVVDQSLDVKDPETILAALELTGSNLLCVTPTAYHAIQLAAERQKAALTHVDFICGGEPLRISQRERANSARIINHYGPSETHVALSYDVPDGEFGEIVTGAELGDARVYVLSSGLRPVPLGAIGEVWIGGARVGRGYFGNPRNTAERFWPDPFATEPGARMYRTGDLARLVAPSSIHILGREDHQTKIRGQRVEPGEVAAALERHPLVRGALVRGVVAAGGGGTQLAAWLTGHPAGVENLRQHLAPLLPEHMIPTRYVWIDEFPLTPHGKVDEQQLLPLLTRREGDPSDPPRTDVERAIATIWESVLQTDHVGRDDNFFAIGGNSLDAARVTFRIRDELKQELPVHALFEAPVLKDLAVHPSLRRGSSSLPLVDRRSRPLASPGQRRMWFHQQDNPGSTTYNLPLVMKTTAALDVGRLQRAVEAVVDRNEVLRTNLQLDERQQLVQVIRSDSSFDFTDFDSSFPACQGMSDFIDLVEGAVAVPFRLDVDAMLRMYHATLSDGAHAIAFVAHHATLDGWSVDLFARQVTQAYEGELSAPSLDARQYVDWAGWAEAQDSTIAGLAYWKRQLARVWDDPLLVLPKHAVRGNGRTATGLIDLTALRASTAALRNQGHSEFNIVLALLQLALHRMTGNHDIRIGVPVSGRTHAATERMLGYFTNMVVIRQGVRTGETLAEAASVTSSTIRDALEHQDVPFDDIVAALNPPRGDFGDMRLFQVCMAFSRGRHSRNEWGLEGTVPEFFSVAPRGVPFPLTVFVEAPSEETAGTLRLVWDEQVVSESQVASLRNALDAVFAESHAGPISWRGGRATNDSVVQQPRTILDVLDRNASDWPTRAFLEEADGSFITYGDAARRVHSAAAWLLSHGLKPGDYVMIQDNRGAMQTLAMLAVMKAGLIYVPARPDEPAERLRTMIGDLPVAALLGRSESPALDMYPNVMSIALETLLNQPGEGGLPDIPLDPEQCAYALFTSGTTGVPKAALVRHDNLFRLGCALDGRLNLSTGSRVLAYASPVFDASLLELVLALTAAGTLLFLELGTRGDPAALADALVSRSVDVTLLTPTILRALPRNDAWSGVLLSGGESLDSALAAKFMPLIQSGRLWNAYGPTEATVVATLHRVTEGDVQPKPSAGRRAIPIGTALTGTSARVFRPDGAEARPGEVGELVLSGGLVGAGYAGRSELTEDRFPFDAQGERSYRTGDRAYVNQRGELVYDGRVDEQVKIGGQRIELGEVEAAFVKVTGATVAAAVVDQDELLRVFYIAETAADEDFVRRKLLDYLPVAMVPQRLERISSLPTLASGKIDRARLGARSVAATGAPTTSERENESFAEAIANIWRDVLACPSLTPDDNFFDLGGTSLGLLRVLSRMREELGVQANIGDIMAAQTARMAAARLERIPTLTRRVAGHHIVLNPPLLPVSQAVRYLTGCLNESGVLSERIVSANFELSDTKFSFVDACERAYLRANVSSSHVVFIGWSIGGIASLEMARQATVAGHSASVLLLDTIKPGSHLFRIGARLTGRRIDRMSSDALSAPASWLRQIGFTEEFGAALTPMEWGAVKRQLTWQLCESSDYRVSEGNYAIRVLLASGSKSLQEIQRLRDAWEVTGNASVRVVPQSHEQLLTSSSPLIASQAIELLTLQERN